MIDHAIALKNKELFEHTVKKQKRDKSPQKYQTRSVVRGQRKIW